MNIDAKFGTLNSKYDDRYLPTVTPSLWGVDKIRWCDETLCEKDVHTYGQCEAGVVQCAHSPGCQGGLVDGASEY